MIITSTAASRVVGDQTSMQKLLQENTLVSEQTIQLDSSDPVTNTVVLERLSLVSSLIESKQLTQQNFQVFVNINNTPEGISSAQEILSGISHRVMVAPSSIEHPQADDLYPIKLVPTAGGMALGLVGGIGLGMAIDALRSTANATGNPILGNLAIGLGLIGTAIGGAAGATGTVPDVEIPNILKLSYTKLDEGKTA